MKLRYGFLVAVLGLAVGCVAVVVPVAFVAVAGFAAVAGVAAFILPVEGELIVPLPVSSPDDVPVAGGVAEGT